MREIFRRRLENSHVAFWLLKDASWCQSWHALGLTMAVPTLLVAFWLLVHSESFDELIHNLATCLWICANITWMIGEFFFNDGLRGRARIFFYSGLAVLFGYYGYELACRFWDEWTAPCQTS